MPQAISEGRRLYVGNMPYTAKMEDVKELFSKGGFEAYVYPALFYIIELSCGKLTDGFLSSGIVHASTSQSTPSPAATPHTALWTSRQRSLPNAR